MTARDLWFSIALLGYAPAALGAVIVTSTLITSAGLPPRTARGVRFLALAIGIEAALIGAGGIARVLGRTPRPIEVAVAIALCGWLTLGCVAAALVLIRSEEGP